MLTHAHGDYGNDVGDILPRLSPHGELRHHTVQGMYVQSTAVKTKTKQTKTIPNLHSSPQLGKALAGWRWKGAQALLAAQTCLMSTFMNQSGRKLKIVRLRDCFLG
jgi:hypothetical protein